jgi:signal transduction histidine kinase
VSREPVAGLLISAAGLLPLLGVAVGWDWYLDGPAVIGLAVAGGYAAGAWLPPRRAAAGVLAASAGLVTANQLHGVEFHWLDDAVFFLVAVGGPAGAGAAVAFRARQVHHLDRLRAELAEQQRLEVATARLEEQTRIQREVHALLAERVAGIAVRAEGAQRSPDPVAFADLEREARGVQHQLRAALG